MLKIIKLYQGTLSLDHGWFKTKAPGGLCRYQPTCSEYTYQAIEKFGVLKGGIRGLWRVLRCNPLSKGGRDPVEK